MKQRVEETDVCRGQGGERRRQWWAGARRVIWGGGLSVGRGVLGSQGLCVDGQSTRAGEGRQGVGLGAHRQEMGETEDSLCQELALGPLGLVWALLPIDSRDLNKSLYLWGSQFLIVRAGVTLSYLPHKIFWGSGSKAGWKIHYKSSVCLGTMGSNQEREPWAALADSVVTSLWWWGERPIVQRDAQGIPSRHVSIHAASSSLSGFLVACLFILSFPLFLAPSLIPPLSHSHAHTHRDTHALTHFTPSSFYFTFNRNSQWSHRKIRAIKKLWNSLVASPGWQRWLTLCRQYTTSNKWKHWRLVDREKTETWLSRWEEQTLSVWSTAHPSPWVGAPTHLGLHHVLPYPVFWHYLWLHHGFTQSVIFLSDNRISLHLATTFLKLLDKNPLPHTHISLQRELHTHDSSFSSVQFSSVAQLCPTLCDPMNRSTPCLSVHHQLPEFTCLLTRKFLPNFWSEDFV